MNPRLLGMLLYLPLAGAACVDPGPGPSLRGQFVRVGHPEAWFVAFGGDGSATFSNATLGVTVEGVVSVLESGGIEILVDAPGRGIPERMGLTTVDAAGSHLLLSDATDSTWDLVRAHPIPRELLGRWLTLPHADPRYFIELRAPHDVLWRRRFGMRRSEDRIGRGWVSGDSLFLHIWGAPPMHYEFDIARDTLSFERPGIGPFGRYVRSSGE